MFGIRWRVVLLMNRLFGWDYVEYEPSSRELHYKRLHTLPNGRQFIRYLGSCRYVDDKYEWDRMTPFTFNWPHEKADILPMRVVK